MIDPLLRDLSDPSAYPHPVDDVEVHQTHISLVFLAGDFAYKLKKPLRLSFVDYSTLEKRRCFCRREVELNQKLAKDVYLAVVPVVFDESTRRHRVLSADIDPTTIDAPIIEWAVQMRRLRQEHTLASRLRHGQVPDQLFERLGRLLADFHTHADRSPEIARFAQLSEVTKNALENFEDSRRQADSIIDAAVFTRLEALTHQRLEELGPLIQDRARREIPRDTHGDLRLEHIYIDEAHEIRIVDCIEFNDAFRFADPISDLAFLAMDLGLRGFIREEEQLLNAYFDAIDDDQGRQLLDFYAAYRSCVRAKIHGIKALSKELPKALRERSHRLAKAHWLYALTRLEDPGQGPALLLLAGLPTTGKSTLARRLLNEQKIDLILETDAVRKELAGVEVTQKAPEQFYSPEFSRRTYNEVLTRASDALSKGKRVAVAATFIRDTWRLDFIKAARQLGLPVRFIECVVDEETALQRLEDRRDDISDADLQVYQSLKSAWEPPSTPVERVLEVYDTSN